MEYQEGRWPRDTPEGMERYVWHEAFGACPFYCDYDADALVDTHTGHAIQWRCAVCRENIRA